MKKLILILMLILLLLIPVLNFSQSTTKVGVDLIKTFEGFRSKSYLCPASVWTIGYGSTEGIRKGLIITRDEAEQLLIKDLIRFEKHVNSAIYRPLKWHEFDPLVSFSFNVGYRINGNLRDYINKGNANSAMYLLKRYNRARVSGVLIVLPGLQRRREAESFLYLTGDEKELRKKYNIK